MRKRTDFQTPEDRKASPNQTKGLIAKGQKPGESVQEECVLDNLSHRTLQKLLNRPQTWGSQDQLLSRLKSSSQAPAGIRPVGTKAAAGGRSQQLFCYGMWAVR